jgi:hypothetical protein
MFMPAINNFKPVLYACAALSLCFLPARADLNDFWVALDLTRTTIDQGGVNPDHSSPPEVLALVDYEVIHHGPWAGYRLTSDMFDQPFGFELEVNSAVAYDFLSSPWIHTRVRLIGPAVGGDGSISVRNVIGEVLEGRKDTPTWCSSHCSLFAEVYFDANQPNRVDYSLIAPVGTGHDDISFAIDPKNGFARVSAVEIEFANVPEPRSGLLLITALALTALFAGRVRRARMAGGSN